MSKIKVLDHKNFEDEVSNSTLPLLVDFWAEWCGPCKTLTPILEELSSELENKIQIAKVNLDENQDLAAKFSIRSIPTLLLFKNGELIDTKVGLSPKNDLSEWIENKID
ncbi:MAG: Thioredoxin C-1 [Alphaproteobacteria bacterium MarineAlpha8_Bin1]|nr:MAG: Thioredoxin C-1 [Alphaproteobacteria bacterium MarineAlpha8_Bin1]|tara:strand:+ start:147 stop:473 length:327 start_codon:yes stop_codon:yes gene_type:complete